MQTPDTPTAERGQLQLERLQSTLNRVYRSVPFYRNRFQAQGLDPAQIESLADITRLPLTHRRHLGEHYPYGLFAVPLRDIVRIHTAPGTTLNPTVSGYAKQDLVLWREIVARALGAAGVTPHDILQISLDPGLANWGRDYKDGAEAIEAGVIPTTPLSLEKQVMVLRDYKTSVLVTTPSSAAQLTDYLFRKGVNPGGFSLKRLILVGDPVDRAFREELESRLRVSSWLHYGLSEVPGPAIGFECREHDGLHLNEDHFLAEIIDPRGRGELPEGEAGELVLTSLTTQAFPLIRFRTGDRASLDRTPCSCGSTLARMRWFDERVDDMISLRGVKIDPGQVVPHVQRALGYAPQTCRCFKNRQDGMDWLEVWIAVNDDLFSDEIKMLQKTIREVGDSLQEGLGVPVIVRLREKSTCDIPEG